MSLGEDYNPVLQTIGFDGTLLGDDSAGQAGICALVEEYNDWCARSETPGKAKPLLTAVVPEDDATGQ